MAHEWCKTCDEFANTETHRCPPAWRGWLEENGDCDGEDAEAALEDVSLVVHANTPYMAADAYAKKLCSLDTESWEQFEQAEEPPIVCVRRELGDQTIHRFRVTGALVQEFYPLKIN